jgi:hypothetical protein
MIPARCIRLIITEIIGTASTTTAKIITSPIIAAAAYKPPNANEPTSPINIDAGSLFQTKNPKQTPPIAMKTIEVSNRPVRIENTAQATEAIPNIPDARPSIPSIKLTALIDPTTPTIVIGIAKNPT